MEILLIRHGQSERPGGGQKDIPLSEAGQAEAYATGRMLKGAGISRVYTSPLSRAWKTAALIGGEIGREPISDTNLMERSHGMFDGLTREELAHQYPEELARIRLRPLEAAPGGESFDDVGRRVDAFLGDRIDGLGDQDIVAVVSHGNFMNIFLMRVLQIPESLYPLFHFDTASVSSVAYLGQGQFRLRYVNRLPERGIGF